MGINIIIAHQIWDLWKAGTFSEHKSILELAPQNLATETGRYQCYKEFAREKFGDCEAVRAFERDAFDADGKTKRTAQRSFYRLFGLTDYASIDYIDETATYRGNLNEPIDLGRQFDVVAEFGTAEHIFNIGQFFANAYNFLRPGGIALHQLPMMGQIHHGFYNIHSVFYQSLAAAGLYELVKLDFTHALDFYIEKMERTRKLPKLYDIRERDAPQTTLRFYLIDIWKALTDKKRVQAAIFAAMRKIDDKPFFFPQQVNKYWVPPSTEAGTRD